MTVLPNQRPAALPTLASAALAARITAACRRFPAPAGSEVTEADPETSCGFGAGAIVSSGRCRAGSRCARSSILFPFPPLLQGGRSTEPKARSNILPNRAAVVIGNNLESPNQEGSSASQ